MKGLFGKRFLALCLGMILVASCFVGCGGKKKTTAIVEDDNEQVTLKWILSGPGMLKDSQKVFDEFNKELVNYLPNTQVEFEVIPASDFAEKWRLMSASREEADLVWVGWVLNLREEARKGSFYPMDELLEAVPDLTAEIPSHIIDLGRINGKLYCIPNYQMMVNLPMGVKVHKELADKYDLDTDGITEMFATDEMITKEDYKIFEDFLERVKQGGDLKQGVAASMLATIVGSVGTFGENMETVAGNAVIDMRDDSLQVYDLISDFPESEDAYAIANEWFKKGYVRKDILSVTDLTAEVGKENGYIMWSESVFKDDSEKMTKKWGFPILSIPARQALWIPHSTPTTNTGIAATSKHPKRAMKLIELMCTEKGKDLYNLLCYGLEGVHYEKVSDTEINWLEEDVPGSSNNNYGYSSWAIGNTFNAYTTQYDVAGWNEYILNDINGKAKPSPLVGFSFDPSPVKLELAQYEAVKKEYTYLYKGATDNWKELLEERNKKMKAAGSDKIVEEVRRQIEEWKKTVGK
ncbi:MAG: ABC transporter substrate-binding protein [Clostridia bacterium]|nr:ABC transporter substrate-binding protein [Clostridia bacterium]